MLADLVHRHCGVEQAEDVARQVERQPSVGIGALGNRRRIRRVIEHAAHAHVKVVRVGVQEEEVLRQAFRETLRDVAEQADDIGLEGEELVGEVPAEGACVAEARGDHHPLVLRTVLVAETEGHVRVREVRAAEQGVGQADELGDAEGAGDAELRGADLVLGLELEVAFQTHVEQFAAVEEILVEVIELRGDAEQAGGVHRGFQVRLEALDAAVQEVDVTVHDVVRDRVHRDVHAVEDGEVRQA